MAPKAQFSVDVGTHVEDARDNQRLDVSCSRLACSPCLPALFYNLMLTHLSLSPFCGLDAMVLLYKKAFDPTLFSFPTGGIPNM